MSSIIGKVVSFPKGSIKEVRIQGKPYAISNIDGELFAIDGRCAHAGGILSNGHLTGKVVTCPKHGAEYDVTTGKNIKNHESHLLKLQICEAILQHRWG